jgi:hypothetical protein
MLDARTLAAGDGDSIVAAAAIDDDDLVGPGGAVDGGSDVLGFVERDDRDGDSRHLRILHSGRRWPIAGKRLAPSSLID